MKLNYENGFTVIELMITILLLGVLAGVAVPSFASILKQNRLSAQTNTILSSLNYARSETITQNTDVVIAPLVAGIDWSAGWTTSVDGTVLRNFESFSNASVTSSVAILTYKSDGSLDSGAPVTITLTPDECPTGSSDIRIISVSLSGQSRSTSGNCT